MLAGLPYQFNYDVSSPEFGDDMELNNGTVSAQVIDLDLRVTQRSYRRHQLPDPVQ
ncbi:MAG: hypothetical protein IPL86_11770 [Flavobacteriales bacterium]|nr:hypothetical protein [Flavobacteriales bacterium]